MDRISKRKSQTYTITFHGRLDQSWQTWFAGFSISTACDKFGNTLTILTGTVVDQAALRGILNKLWDLNFDLVSIQRVE